MSSHTSVAQGKNVIIEEEVTNKANSRIDWVTMILPLLFVVIMSVIIISKPDQSAHYLRIVRTFVGDDCGIYYQLIAGGIFVVTMYMAFSKFGAVKLGSATDKKAYSDFKWGSMIFTSTMGADILFYSLTEWSMYAGDKYVVDKGVEEWAPTYALFHWGPIGWGMYIVLAVAFGYMINVRKCNKQKFSEACRSVLGNKIVDGWVGKAIDIIAVFALICGVTTTFSVSAPLLSEALSRIAGFTPNATMQVSFILIITCVYTLAVVLGMKGISKLSSICIYLFLGLLAYFFIFGGEQRFILESSYQSLGKMFGNLSELTTYMDPLRKNSFPQNWSIYYWAYWLVYCAGTPFFIGAISKGRTIKNTVLGGYAWALAGTFMSFMILGNYSMAQQYRHGVDIIGYVDSGATYSEAVIKIFDTMPLPAFGLLLLIITMITFYSTTIDSITMVISTYSYKKINAGEEPEKKVLVFWSLILVVLPIAMILTRQDYYCIQSVTIIGAAPIGLIMVIIIMAFFKDIKKDLSKKEEQEVQKEIGKSST